MTTTDAIATIRGALGLALRAAREDHAGCRNCDVYDKIHAGADAADALERALANRPKATDTDEQFAAIILAGLPYDYGDDETYKRAVEWTTQMVAEVRALAASPPRVEAVSATCDACDGEREFECEDDDCGGAVHTHPCPECAVEAVPGEWREASEREVSLTRELAAERVAHADTITNARAFNHEVVAAWLRDRVAQFDNSSGYHAFVDELTDEVLAGEVEARFFAGEFDDLLAASPNPRKEPTK